MHFHVRKDKLGLRCFISVGVFPCGCLGLVFYDVMCDGGVPVIIRRTPDQFYDGFVLIVEHISLGES